MAAAAAAGAAYAAACAAAKAAKKAYKTAGVMDDSYQLVYAPPNKLTIAEAFTLLWQDAETGDISGRHPHASMFVSRHIPAQCFRNAFAHRQKE